MPDFIIGLLIGIVIGAAVTIVITVIRSRAERQHLAAATQQMREAFAAIAAEALDANSKRLADQTAATLDSKKALIDQSVKAVNERLGQLGQFMQKTESDHQKAFGSLSNSVASLSTTTGELHKVLASSQRRGAWGERMAEDILRLAGLVEKVNYAKQSSEDAESGRPDFTFFLPNDLKVNMDVKFPLDAYRAYLDAETDDARDGELRSLTTAVRNHIRAVAGRGYVDVKGGTVDYAIVFIATEQIVSLVLGAQPDLIDEALAKRIVLVSPMTLYAMLAVIRQAAENANIMRTADEVLGLLTTFNKQWQATASRWTSWASGSIRPPASTNPSAPPAPTSSNAHWIRSKTSVQRANCRTVSWDRDQ